MTVSQRATIRQNDAFGSRLENGRDSKENSEGEIYTKFAARTHDILYQDVAWMTHALALLQAWTCRVKPKCFSNSAVP